MNCPLFLMAVFQLLLYSVIPCIVIVCVSHHYLHNLADLWAQGVISAAWPESYNILQGNSVLESPAQRTKFCNIFQSGDRT